jgi:hypothetical protein
MSRKVKLALLLSAFFLCAVSVVWIQITPPNEPVYQNRPLKSWLSALGHGNDTETAASEKALRELYRSDTPTWLRSAAAWMELRLSVRFTLRSDRERWLQSLASAMLPLLSDADPAVRSGAARALELCTAQAARVAPALKARLDDSDQRTRLWATRSIGQMVSEPQIVIPALITALNDADPNVRAYACIELERFGASASEAVPTLRAVIAKYPNSWRAVESLKTIAGDTH